MDSAVPHGVLPGTWPGLATGRLLRYCNSMWNMSNNDQPSSQPRVLIANDQEWTARSLETILSAEGYAVTRAYTGQQAVDRALATRPDLVVLDVQLPDISGPEVCRTLRSDPRVGPGTPIILTTAGSNGRARQAECFEAGAWEFAPQPFDGPLLLLKIRTFLASKQALEEARAAALLDPSTGLYNPKGLVHRLKELGAARARAPEDLSCLLLSAGSPELVEAAAAAEETGRALARAIREGVRASDVVARLSPLEYAIVAPSLDRGTARNLVERIQRLLTASRPTGAATLSVRAGVVLLPGSETVNPEEVLQRAGAALGQATTEQPVLIS
jgi:two-component system, cell cycle response regulator